MEILDLTISKATHKWNVYIDCGNQITQVALWRHDHDTEWLML